jgi:hypothetical protein
MKIVIKNYGSEGCGSSLYYENTQNISSATFVYEFPVPVNMDNYSSKEFKDLPYILVKIERYGSTPLLIRPFPLSYDEMREVNTTGEDDDISNYVKQYKQKLKDWADKFMTLISKDPNKSYLIDENFLEKELPQ